MSKPEKLKKLHSVQNEFAQKQFEQYKLFITKEFIEAFGGSYQTAEQIQDSWRKEFEYSAEREEFLQFKTRVFIRMQPIQDGITNSPRYLKHLLHHICDYLSVFVNKKNAGLNRNVCTNELYETLYAAYAQKVGDSYEKEKKRQWGLQQKATRASKRPRKPKAQKINYESCKTVSVAKGEEIVLQPAQREKLLYKQMQKKRKELEKLNLKLNITNQYD